MAVPIVFKLATITASFVIKAVSKLGVSGMIDLLSLGAGAHYIWNLDIVKNLRQNYMTKKIIAEPMVNKLVDAINAASEDIAEEVHASRNRGKIKEVSVNDLQQLLNQYTSKVNKENSRNAIMQTGSFTSSKDSWMEADLDY